MDIKELRIGNLVGHDIKIWTSRIESYPPKKTDKNFTFKWDESDFYGLSEGLMVEDAINPIPLTEEWLLRFGFEKDGTNTYEILNCLYWLDDGRMQIAMGMAPIINCPCKYVHQLQNLYFALTGEELDYED